MRCRRGKRKNSDKYKNPAGQKMSFREVGKKGGEYDTNTVNDAGTGHDST